MSIERPHTLQILRRVRGGLAMLLLLALLPLPALPADIAAPLVPVASAASVSNTPAIEGCEAQIYNGGYLDPNSTITPLRRQPFEHTLATTPTLSVAGNTIFLNGGRVTLPQLKMALASYATSVYTQSADIERVNGLLQQSGPDTWLLRGNLQINRAAALSVVGTPAVTMTLRIESTAAITPALTLFNYGYLRFQDASVTSWDTTKNAVDSYYKDGRPYLVAFEGGRMDFYGSEAAYLGYTHGERSGIAWRKCYDENNFTTGATGDIHDTELHHNYFGMYSYESFGLWAKRVRMHHNIEYGFDPHDYSDYFIFEENIVYNNGNHGIIFSRWCDYNIIRNNIVFNNAKHGIMLDRRSNYNLVVGNTVYNNKDGVAIFQSQHNIVANNTIRNNLTGVRINATPVPPKNGVPDRTPDFPSLFNIVRDNAVRDNNEYGIYLYNRADRTTISGNTVTGNGRRDAEPGVAFGSGIHIKTGGNTIGPNNIVKENGHGISLLTVDASRDPVGDGEDGDQQPDPRLASLNPGLPTAADNLVESNTITTNKGRGLRMVGANRNTVRGNEIASNIDEGIYSDGGSDNLFAANFIHRNGAPSGQVNDEGVADLGNYGVNIKGNGAARNQLTRNRITANGRKAIKLGSNTNANLEAPVISEVQVDRIVGTALPNATIEVFRDPRTGCGVATCGDEAAEFVGTTTADASGVWQLAIVTESGFNYAATQTTAQKNTSELSSQRTAPTIAIGRGRKGGTTIYVSGSNAELTLKQVQIGLQAIGRPELLTDDGIIDGKQTWTLHASLFISPTVSLRIVGGDEGAAEGARVDWLRLFSVPDRPGYPLFNPADPERPIYDYDSFATLMTYNGNILIKNSRITSWDTQSGGLDLDYGDGRAFILAKYDADLTIINSDVSYLGFADGEAYGLSWRDVNSTADPPDAPRRSRVTGQVIDSIVSNNYYGIYTFQARDMLFRGNKFHSNIQYGFDPHDFTRDVIVENNEAYNNGSHGFIISRGCSNFVFRNNISRDNKVKPGSKNPSAHAFMLDPGAAPEKAGVPQVPSVFNLLENNIAYGNDGYAIRIYGSDDNIIRNNLFYNNRAGITIEKGSTRNIVEGNVIKDSTGEPVFDPVTGQTTTKGGYGVYTLRGADNNQILGNTITGNINTGIYLKTGGNIVQQNLVADNRGDGIGTLRETSADAEPEQPQLAATPDPFTPGAFIDDQEPSGVSRITLPDNNQIISNTVRLNGGSGVEIKGATSTLVQGNIVAENGRDGIYIADGSTATLVRANSIQRNSAYGIKVNGSSVQRNTLTRNSVTGNNSGGIAVTGGANGGLGPVRLTVMTTDASRLPDTNAPAGSWQVTGTTVPGARVELFSDSVAQAATYEGSVTADERGLFTFFTGGPPDGRRITATATDDQGNTSALSKPAKNPNSPLPDGDYIVLLPLVRAQP